MEDDLFDDDDIADNKKDEEVIDEAIDPNEDDFFDLWEKDTNEPPTTEDDKNNPENKNDNPPTDKPDDKSTDEPDGEDTDDDTLELELVDGYDKSLVSKVEVLSESDQLYLDSKSIKEIFDGTPASYDKLIEANKAAMNNHAINTIYELLPTKGKDFFKYIIDTNGAGDLEGWLSLEAKAIDLMKIDVNSISEEQAKAIIREDHKAKGLTDKQSKYILEAHEDNADLLDEAKTIYKLKTDAIAVEKAAKLEADKNLQLENQKVLVKRQQDVVKAINDTKYTTKKQQELYNFIYSNDNKTGNTKIVDAIANIIQSKPSHLVQLATLFDGYTPEKGFDLSYLKKQVETEVIKKTKATIKLKTKPDTKGSQTSKDINGRDVSMEDWLSDVEL